ncbi:hypothetical protein DTO212C5_6150 [Paecilomyces variotii]|nr:hypothetical protein DTO212C5_6150 [Paecilomyces variotii]
MSSDPAPESRDRSKSLRDAIEHLESVAYLPPKQRHTSVSELAKTIASDAYESGIPLDSLDRLIDVITKPNHLDQGTTTTLLKNLYPVDKVPSDVITRIVGCLGPSKGKPSPATQALLLRWLILIYDVVEEPLHLSRLYAVLFNHLDMISLRRPLCQLLSMITRRQHVKPFRIQMLMELLRNVGDDERELMGLLRIFKNYYPDIIVGDVGGSRRTTFFFKHPDPEFTAHLKVIQEAHLERLRMSGSSTFQIVRRGGVKRSKIEAVIPDVQTTRVQRNHTSLEELRSVNDFIERFDKIELPNQIVSSLADPLAQKYLLLTKSEDASRRLEDWLESFLNDELEKILHGDEADPEALNYVLGATVGYVRTTKTIPSAIRSFIRKYIDLWNGTDNRTEILRILEYLDIAHFEKLQEDILRPLEDAVLDYTVSSKVTILNFYSSLIRQWGSSLRTQKSVSNRPETSPLTGLITHTELLALSILEHPSGFEKDASRPKSATLAVVDFYNTLAKVFSHAPLNGNIRLTIPLPPTVYSLTFTPTITHISLLSSALADYKAAFEASLSSQELQSQVPSGVLYPPEELGRFNGYIMDICNLIWRNRGLNTEDPNALGCLIHPATVKALTEYVHDLNEAGRTRAREDAFHYTTPAMFSLSHHIALCLMSAICFAELEEEKEVAEDQPRLEKPVTQKALTALEKNGGVKITWQEYRIQMLDWLDGVGSEGIAKLMRRTMKALRNEG